MPASIFNGDAVKILKEKLRFKTTGEIGWDAINGCPTYPSDIAGVTNQIGQETHVRVYNATGAIIENGSVVYVDGGVDGDGLHPSVAKAIATSFATSRVLGVVTADIAIGAHGIVTVQGTVNSLDTSAYAPGTVLKLSASVAGTYSSTSLIDGNFDTTIGIVVKQHATDGSILVYNNTAAYTAETVQKTGWSNVYGPATIAFVDATRTLTLSPVGTEFHYYQAGVKYSKTTDSYQIADTEGLHYLYYNAGVITDVINPTNAQVANILQNYTTIAYVGWDATNKLNVFVGIELHDMQFPSLVHNYNHFAYGARYLNGLGPNSIIAEGNGSLDSHAQFGLDAGAIADEDIFLPTSAVISTAGLPIFYLEGTTANPVLRKTTQAGFAVKTTGTGRLAYNFLTGGNWTVAEVTNTNFVLCHVFCIHENDITKRPIAFMGQAQYSTVALARAGAQTEISALVTTGIIPQEIKSIATFVFETRGSYTNSVNARIREISTGVNYIDWRAINNTGGSAASSGSATSIFSDNSFQIYDDLDATKTAQFQASGITTGTNRVLTIPDATTTIVGTDVAQVLTNKTFDDAITHKQIASPSSPAAGYNKLYPKADGIYYYQTPTAEFPVDLKGDYNFIATKLATDFIGYDDGAAAFPVDGTDGAATGCTLVAATSPISTEPGIINLKLTKDAADRQGKGFGLAFNTRGDIDKAAIRVCKINVASTSAYLDGDVIVMLYDTTNSRLIYPSDQRIFASSLVSAQQFEFQLSSDSTAYRLILHIASTNASAYELNMVAKFVETKKQTGPVFTKPLAYTLPSAPSNVTVSTKTGKWQKKANEIKIQGELTISAVPSGVVTYPVASFMPTGISVDTSQFNGQFLECVGECSYIDVSAAAGADTSVGTVGYATGAGGLVFNFADLDAWDANTPVVGASGDIINFTITLPVTGWDVNQVLSEDAGNRLIYTRATMSNQSIASSSPTKIALSSIGSQDRDTVGAFDLANNRINILETGFYSVHTNIFLINILNELVILSIKKNGSLDIAESATGFGPLQGSIVLSDCFYLTKGDYLEIFTNSSTDTAYTIQAGSLTVTKISSPQQIAASEKVYAEYTNGTGGTSLADGGTYWTTKITDSHNAYNSATGVFTCPRSGLLTFNCGLAINSYVSNGAGQYVAIRAIGFDWDRQDSITTGQTFPAIIRRIGKNGILVSRGSQIVFQVDKTEVTAVTTSSGSTARIASRLTISID